MYQSLKVAVSSAMLTLNQASFEQRSDTENPNQQV